MPRTATFLLGEVEYTVPALNIDQLERVTELYAAIDMVDRKAVSRLPFQIVNIALERCIVPNPVGVVSPSSLDEVRDAMSKIAVLSGLQQPDANPPKPEPGAA